MAKRSIGLDIGTHAVRAAEVLLGRSGPVLHRFGQVPLPEGAVVAGEVARVDDVISALRRLWSEGGFSSRDVVLGVGNQRTIVRVTDVPSMPEDDLRSALRFQVQDVIPIPVDEAELDFQVVAEHHDGEQSLLRILLVAAHRDAVAGLVAAAEGAGLRPTLVDPHPFALVRALHDPDADAVVDAAGGENDAGAFTDAIDDPARATPTEAAPGDGTDSPVPPGPGSHGRAEAIVAVGGGLTTVVVHVAGVPQFVRVLPRGGAMFTGAVAEELGVGHEEAEALKRGAADGGRGGPQDPPAAPPEMQSHAARVVDQRLAPLLEELRGSLDYYQAQPGAAPLHRVLVTGGGSRIAGLPEHLAAAVGMPVEPARPLERVELAVRGLDDDELARAEDLLGPAVGLALARQPLASGGHRVNLLPGDRLRARAARRQMVAAGAAVAGVAALLGGAWFVRGGEVDRAAQAADRAEARTAELQMSVGELSAVGELEERVSRRQELALTALGDDVAWSRIFQEIATVIPNDVWLTSFEGTAGSPGEIVVTGTGFDHTSAARWLLRVDEVGALTQLWLPSSTRTGGGGRELVTFKSTARLTEDASSDRAEQFRADLRADPEASDGSDDGEVPQ